MNYSFFDFSVRKSAHLLNGSYLVFPACQHPLSADADSHKDKYARRLEIQR